MSPQKIPYHHILKDRWIHVLLLVLLVGLVALPAFAAAGDLDPTFAGDGQVSTDINNGSADYAKKVLLQPDGKIVVAGWSTGPGENNDFAVVRYNPNGSLDASFADGGIQTTELGSLMDRAWDAALQPDGKIILAGTMFNGSNSDLALVRYDPEGNLDPTFDGDGIVTTDLGNLDDVALGVALQADGRILLAGYEWDPQANVGYGTRRFALVRYTPVGSLDLTFGNAGKVLSAFDGLNTYLADVSVQADGKIVVGGTYDNFATDFFEFAVARYNADGSPDVTFGGDGLVTTDIAADSWDNVAAIALQPDGKLVAVGSVFGANGYEFGLARYLADGNLDPTFDSDGKMVTALPVGIGNVANAVVLQPDGKLLVVGYVEKESDLDSVLVRYQPDGSIDSSFGMNGLVITDDGDFIGDDEQPPSPGDSAWSVVLQPDGKIVVAGYTSDFVVTRYKADIIFSGFFQPVDNLPTLNQVKAGMAIPVKFSLNGDQGLNIFAEGYPKSELIPCNSTDPVDGIEETLTAGASSLSYDASTDTYTYIWKTDQAWAGTCRQLVVKLNDGTAHRANFQFTR